MKNKSNLIFLSAILLTTIFMGSSLDITAASNLPKLKQILPLHHQPTSLT